ncbi:MAG: hypothetical protein ACW986_18760 [Promethearchaeota archaeon]|jgi:hypothetical protein
MESLKHEFEKIKESTNPEFLNNFIIELGKNPNEEFLHFLKYFIDNLPNQILDKINLNLIFVIGEIGSKIPLEKDYLQFLLETYYKSDRWIRNEILQALEKISRNLKVDEDLVVLISTAVNDEYASIKLSALSALSNFKSLPNKVLRNIFLVMNSNKSEIFDGCRRVFAHLSLGPQQLFVALDDTDNYKILKTEGIRSLLLIQFKSIINLELFRELILDSGWGKEYKEKFLKEIETFERILVKNQ